MRRGVHVSARPTGKPVKVTLLSAQQAAAYYDPEKSRGAYATLDAYLADVVDFTRREIAELARLGCEYVQIDAPQYAGLLDETVREGYRARGSDPDRMLDATIELDNAIIQGHPGMTFGIHICRGNHKSMFYASGGYDRIAQQVFGRAQFHRFLLEYDDARSGTFEPLRHMPDDRVVVLGLISSKTPRMETAAGLKARIAEARSDRPAGASGPESAVRIRVHRRRQRAHSGRTATEAGTGGIGCARDLELSASRLFVHTLLRRVRISGVLNLEPWPGPRCPESRSRRPMEHDHCSDVNAGFPRPRI